MTAAVLAPWGCGPFGGGSARVVRAAAEQWRVVVNSSACPGLADLLQARLLDPQFASESERARLRISCPNRNIVVTWAGPDGNFGTLDDYTVPDPLGDPRPLTTARIGGVSWATASAALVLTVLAIVATLARWRQGAPLRKLGSAAGWLVCVVFVGAGFLDMTVMHIAATTPGLSPGDAERSRRRGNRTFLAESLVGIAVGVPGVVLRPIRRRRAGSKHA